MVAARQEDNTRRKVNDHRDRCSDAGRARLDLVADSGSATNTNQSMNKKQSVKLIKRHKRIWRRGPKVEVAVGPNKWSKSVRSWVVEFQKRDQTESLPAFASLFKDTQPERTD